jgi:hypothetical protein
MGDGMKHTAGPWEVVEGYDGRRTVAIMRSPRRTVSIMAAPDAMPAPYDATDANAALMKAAPKLLAACKAAFYSEVGRGLAYAVENAGWTWPDDAPVAVSLLAESLREAIALAEGRGGTGEG